MSGQVQLPTGGDYLAREPTAEEVDQFNQSDIVQQAGEMLVLPAGAGV